MTRLLVSVRSASEARAALLGGADVIDVKEPRSGPLGRAGGDVWRAVRAAVPPEVPVSVALGELVDLGPSSLAPADLAGIAFVKAGPAGLGDLARWLDAWDRLARLAPAEVGRVAVAYLDHDRAGAPDPALIVGAARDLPGCAGVLVDTWDKSGRAALDPSPAWRERIAAVQGAGRFVALAGGLDRAAIARLRPLAPDLFAVRSAACLDLNRDGPIDPDRVARLARAIGWGEGTGSRRGASGGLSPAHDPARREAP